MDILNEMSGNFNDLTIWRIITSHKYLASLLIGIVVGFSIANTLEPNSLWLGLSTMKQHDILRDPHSSVDLADAKGPEKGIPPST